ncbi:MAG: elongation factor P, partial [Dongiaceae bacterium]
PGHVIEVDKKLLLVVRVEHRTPGNLRAFVQVEAKDVQSGTKRDFRFSSTEMVERAFIEEIPYQYLYNDGEVYTFMNNENYEQITINRDFLGDSVDFLQDNMTVDISMHEGKPISIVLPETVVMEIVESEPVVKGQTAAGGYKPAKLSNGIRVMVPPFVASGEKVVVNTVTREYVERFKG